MLTKKVSNYFFTYIIIAISGIPFFEENKIFLILAFVLSLLLFANNGLKFDMNILKIIIVLLILTFLQTIKFGVFSFQSFASIFMRFLIPYFVVYSLRDEFVESYVKIIYFFLIISFYFFIPSLFSRAIHNIITQIPSFLGIKSNDGQNFIIYTWEPDFNELGGLTRNDGPFGEPGIFSTFLLLALFFSYLKTETIWTKKNVLFIIGIISTFSTAGYLALMIFIVFHYFKQKDIFVKYLFSGFFLISFIVLFAQLPFMNGKIDIGLERLDMPYSGTMHRDRFLSAKLDIEDLINSPIIGKGRLDETRYYGDVNSFKYADTRTNGLTDFFVKFGIPAAAFYFYFMFSSIRSYVLQKKRKLMYLFLFIGLQFIIGFAQIWFLSLMPISFLYFYLIKTP